MLNGPHMALRPQFAHAFFHGFFFFTLLHKVTNCDFHRRWVKNYPVLVDLCMSHNDLHTVCVVELRSPFQAPVKKKRKEKKRRHAKRGVRTSQPRSRCATARRSETAVGVTEAPGASNAKQVFFFFLHSEKKIKEGLKNTVCFLSKDNSGRHSHIVQV